MIRTVNVQRKWWARYFYTTRCCYSFRFDWKCCKKTPSVWYASHKQMLACLLPVRIASLNRNIDGNTHPLIISLVIDSLQKWNDDKKNRTRYAIRRTVWSDTVKVCRILFSLPSHFYYFHKLWKQTHEFMRIGGSVSGLNDVLRCQMKTLARK